MYSVPTKVNVQAKKLIESFEKGEVIREKEEDEVEEEQKPIYPERNTMELAHPGTARKRLMELEKLKREAEAREKPVTVSTRKLSEEMYGDFAHDRMKGGSEGGWRVSKNGVEHQRVEYQTVEHQKGEYQKGEHQKVGHQAVEHQKVGHPTVEHQKVGHQTVEHHTVEHHKVGHPTVEHQKVGHQTVEHHTVEHYKVEHPTVGHQKVGHQTVEHHTVEHRKVGHPTVEHQKVGHQTVEHHTVERYKVEHPTVGHHKVGHPTVEHHTVGHHKVGHPTVEHQRVGHQTVEHHKVEHHNVDHQGVEQIIDDHFHEVFTHEKKSDHDETDRVGKRQVLVVTATGTGEESVLDKGLVDSVVRVLKNDDHEVHVTDLSHYKDHPLDYSSERWRLMEAQLVVIHFRPILHTVPASILDWFQNVLVEQFAFDRRNGKTFDNGLLKGKRSLLLVTLSEEKSLFGGHSSLGDLSQYLWPIQNGILRYAGFSVLTPHLTFDLHGGSHVTHVDEATEAIANRLRNVWHEKPLFHVEHK